MSVVPFVNFGHRAVIGVGDAVTLYLDRRPRVVVKVMKLGPVIKYELRLRDEAAHVAGGRVMTWHTRNELRRVTVGA